MKKLLSALLTLSLLLCCVTVGISADAASAAGYTLTSIDDKTISVSPKSPEIISVVVFGYTSDSNTQMLLNNLSKSTTVSVEPYQFIYADLNGASKEEITAFSKNYSDEILFCHGNNASTMWNLIREFISGSVRIPVTVFVGSSGDVADVKTGLLSESHILDGIRTTLGDDFIEPPKNPNFTTADVQGRYYTNIQQAIDRINEIRYEACAEGIDNPAKPGTPLTVDDYHPVVWSSELEKIARLRAAEATIRTSHTRPNGKRCFTANTFKSASAVAENLAWNFSTDMLVGIKQFYDEKQDLLNNTGGQTGHYTSMINPEYYSIGLGGFYSNCGSYPSCLCFWLSDAKDGFDKTFGQPTDNVYVPVIVESSHLSNSRLLAPASLRQGASDELTFLADTGFDGIRGFVYLNEDVEWTSSDNSVLTVADGTIQAVGAGKATVTATALCGLSATADVTVTAAPTEAPTAPPTEPVTENPTEDPTQPSEKPTEQSGEIIRGDVDGDNTVTIIDATCIQRQLADLPNRTYNERPADTDGDGTVTIIDATAIQRFLADLGNPYGISEVISEAQEPTAPQPTRDPDELPFVPV